MYKKTTVTAAFFVVSFALLAFFTLTGRMDNFNYSVTAWVYGLENAPLTVILKIITNAGEWFVYVPLALIMVAVPKLRLKYGIPALTTLTISAGLNNILKLCFAVPRPDTHRLIAETGYGFPSGHAMNGAAFIGICVLLFLRYSVSKAHKLIILLSAALFMAAVGFSRVYLGVHNPTDIIAGYAMGLFLCQCAAFMCENFYNHNNKNLK